MECIDFLQLHYPQIAILAQFTRFLTTVPPTRLKFTRKKAALARLELNRRQESLPLQGGKFKGVRIDVDVDVDVDVVVRVAADAVQDGWNVAVLKRKHGFKNRCRTWSSRNEQLKFSLCSKNLYRPTKKDTLLLY